MRPRWDSGPAGLVLVRHGESVGNRADAAAREAGAEELELDARDADVELSDTGREQARALGRWLAERDERSRPTRVVTSPYKRAAETARLALEGVDLPLEHDERLRERDLGVLDGLTGAGIRARHPEEAARRKRLGKFYYQPPSGESWADVAHRVRTFLADLRVGHDGEQVWLFTHQAVIMTFRYVLEGIDEAEVLELDRTVRIPNASVTTYRRRGDVLEPEEFADTTAVDQVDVETTHEAPQGERGDRVG
ncbi:broad specificity phosphatase PhoE [Nocardioides thalensis]|uniref:phosphoglycerate mutase (2,3-diphosphoglycerate-dependent) n=1 Tax=Nocardioides thalensis TaxID=1914755 RepID=A0A853C7H1_9ACTN|nr:histidine phosphatase family protein [Nocardioides thalensis]NYJ02956.1 broad specificity phosphatase PhoE [Nocardioides thalensis]